jgi:outer membrane protein
MIMVPRFMKACLVFATFSVVGMSGNLNAQENSVNLTLKQAIQMAVEKNLDLKAELYNPAAAEADIRKNKGIYDPLLNLLLNYQETNTQSASAYTSGTPVSRQRIFDYNAGISQLIPFGGSFGISFNNTWYRNNSDPARFLTDYYNSDVSLYFSQPLLKNFGTEATELNIQVAKFGKEGALEQFRAKLTDIVAQVRNQYFLLYSLREYLEVRKTSLALAERILSDTRAQVKAGVLPAMEILNSEFGVATMQKNLIDAERALKDQVDSLRLLLQLPVGKEIVPVDTPYHEQYVIDEDAAIRKALAERPELKQLRITRKTGELQSRVARNQTLPDVSLVLNASLTGLGPEYNRALDRVVSGKYPIWGGGLQFTYPLGNRTAENEYIKSKIRVEQTTAQIKSLEESVANDVRFAVRALEAGYKQLDVTERGSAYSEERLNAYMKKNKVGLATLKDVLDVQNDMVSAKGNRIRAIAEYNIAITALWKASGELLEREGIVVSEKDGDALYEKNR